MMPALAPDLCEVSSLLSSSTVAQRKPQICGKKPKYVENGFKHPFCSRTCARVAQSLLPNNGQCLLTGCRAAGRATMGNFCSDAHGRCVASLIITLIRVNLVLMKHDQGGRPSWAGSGL